MTDNRKEEAIRLIAEGNHSLAEIAKKIGIHYQTIFKWKADENFTRALRREVIRQTALAKIDEAIMKADLSKLDAETLLEIRREVLHAG